MKFKILALLIIIHAGDAQSKKVVEKGGAAQF